MCSTQAGLPLAIFGGPESRPGSHYLVAAGLPLLMHGVNLSPAILAVPPQRELAYNPVWGLRQQRFPIGDKIK